MPVLFEHAGVFCSDQLARCGFDGTGGGTCVLNPCGHVASRDLCAHWAAVGIRVMNGGRAAKGTEVRAKCPFCSTVLCRDGAEGGSFNKLLFQSDEPAAHTTSAFSPTSVAQRSRSSSNHHSNGIDAKPPSQAKNFLQGAPAGGGSSLNLPGYLL